MNAKNANIVIIGGGVIGTSTAFHLAEAGHEDIVLLDSGPIANGTTQFAAGQTAYLTSHKNAMPFSLYCTEFFETFAEKTGYAIDFRQSGSLRIAMTDAYKHRVHEYVAAAVEVGDEERVHLISSREALEMGRGGRVGEWEKERGGELKKFPKRLFLVIPTKEESGLLVCRR